VHPLKHRQWGGKYQTLRGMQTPQFVLFFPAQRGVSPARSTIRTKPQCALPPPPLPSRCLVPADVHSLTAVVPTGIASGQITGARTHEEGFADLPASVPGPRCQ
jgi:hypothetical protein